MVKYFGKIYINKANTLLLWFLYLLSFFEVETIYYNVWNSSEH